MCECVWECLKMETEVLPLLRITPTLPWKKYAFAHSAWNRGIKRDDRRFFLNFVPHFESSSQASDVLCDFFRSCSTTKSRKQEDCCEGNRFIEVSDTGSVTSDTELNDWEESQEYTQRNKQLKWNSWSDTTWVEQDNYEVPLTETSWLII